MSYDTTDARLCARRFATVNASCALRLDFADHGKKGLSCKIKILAIVLLETAVMSALLYTGGLGLFAVLGVRTYRRRLSVRPPLLTTNASASDVVSFVTSMQGSSCDELVHNMCAFFEGAGVSEALLQHISRLLKAVPDPAGTEAFALTVVYSTILLVIKEHPHLLLE